MTLREGRDGLTESQGYLELARGLLDASPAPTCAVDSASKIVAVNQAWRDFAGLNGGSDEMCGVGVSYFDACDNAGGTGDRVGAAEAAIVAQGLQQVLTGARNQFGRDYECHSPAQNHWFSVRITPAVINNGSGAVISHRDVTDMHQIQRALAHQSLHDTLTGLPNRALILDRLERADAVSVGPTAGIALTHLDLHRFQRVNDSLGYRGGDDVLVQVAERLQAQLRPGDTLARSSGDEFLVLWSGLDDDRPEQAVELSETLVRGLDRPFEVAGTSVQVSASAGVTTHTPGRGVDELLQSVDAALRDAKGRGAGHVVLSTQKLKEASKFFRTLEADLQQALKGAVTEFVLYHQPVVDLTSGKVVAVESLVRWQHPVLGLLHPDRFIPLAEATGLIHPLGEWVLDQAIRDAASMTHQGRELDIAVNLSVRQLDDQVVEKVRQALKTSGLRPGRLILELTESAFVENEEITAATLRALSELGVKIAIDDFGTGYSSLLYLRRYPINALKIDREFVAGIGTSADDEAICSSITSLAVAVGASTVGEGVETSTQYAVLRSLGCDQGQGFLWSPPVPVGDLEAAFGACDKVPVAAPQTRMPRATEGLSADVTGIITAMHAKGASLHTIAAALNRTVGRNPQGVRWTAGAVARGLPAEAQRTADQATMAGAPR